MDEHSLAGKHVLQDDVLGRLDVPPGLGRGVGGLDLGVHRAVALELPRSGDGRVEVRLEPEAGVPAVARGDSRVPEGGVPGLDPFGIGLRVVVGDHAEDVAGGVVGASDRRDRDVALVLALRPVDDVVLPIHAEVEAFDVQTRKLTLAFGEEGHCLFVEEVDAVVEQRRRDFGRLADSPQGHLADEVGEDGAVLVGANLAGDGVAPLGLHGERLAAPGGLAAVALAAGGGLAELVVGPGDAGRDAVVLAVHVRA